MLLKITVNDNDFTEYLEQFAKDLELSSYYYKLIRENKSLNKHWTYFERLRQLFYNTDKYTPELAKELCDIIKQGWEIFVKETLELEDYQDDKTREYLIKNFKVKFQKTLTPHWENGEVVYICCGYYNKYWTF